MPTFSNTNINKSSPLNILTNNVYFLTLTTNIYDDLPLKSVTINTNSPLLLKFDNSLVNSNNKGDYVFEIKITSNDYSLGKYLINFVINATNTSNVKTSEIINFEIVVSKYILNEATCYININANINNSLIINNNNLELQSKIINHLNPNFNAEYNLPEGTLNIDTGNITIKSNNNLILGTFSSYLIISARKDGTLNSKIEITGDPILVSIEDNPHKAEKIYWPDDILISNSYSSDILESTITSTKLKSILSEKINDIENLYNLNIISGWSMKIDKLSHNGLPNVIDKYAEDFNRTYPNIFNEGEFITLETKFNYNVEIYDFNETLQEIIPNTLIFAKITQNKNSPLLI